MRAAVADRPTVRRELPSTAADNTPPPAVDDFVIKGNTMTNKDAIYDNFSRNTSISPKVLKELCAEIGIGKNVLDDIAYNDIAERISRKILEITVDDFHFQEKKKYSKTLFLAINTIKEHTEEEINRRLHLREYLQIFTTNERKIEDILQIAELNKLLESTNRIHNWENKFFDYRLFKQLHIYYLEDMIRIIFKSHDITLGFSSEAGKGTILLSRLLEYCDFGSKKGSSPEAIIKMKKRLSQRYPA